MSRLLQIVGIVALLGWTGGGLVAWQLVGQQVHVTIAEGDDPADASAAALARMDDRLGTLESDLRALVSALGENLGAMDEGLRSAVHDESVRVDQRLVALQRSVAERDGELATQPEMRALRADVARLETTLTAVAAGLANADAGVLAAAAGGAEAAPGATELAAADAPRVDQSEPAASEPEPAAEPETASVPDPAPPKKRSFLAFQLPSDDVKFDEPRTWLVLPTLSRVGFDAKSTLHDFTGVTSKISAELTANLAHPEAGASGRIVVSADALQTGLEDRDVAMYEHLDTENHDQIVWEMTAFEPEHVDADKRELRGNAKGRMTIHGVTREISMPVQLSIDESRRLVIEGEMPLRLSDYDVPVPNKLGLVKMDEEVRVWISLRARAAPRRAE